MRYRITLEIDTDANRIAVNNLAAQIKDAAVTSWCSPVYLATEVVGDMQVIRERRLPS